MPASALVLAGGSGTRFWPASRRSKPKQLLALEGERTLLQATVDRLAPLIPADRVWIATTTALAGEIRVQLPEVASERILVEPALRNTAPAVPGLGQDLGIARQYDFGADVGGKLIQDKLWFFAAVSRTSLDNDFLTRANLPFTTEQRNTLFSGKLTWQASPNHQIVGSFFGDPGERSTMTTGQRNTVGIISNNLDTSNYNYNLTYNGSSARACS